MVLFSSIIGSNVTASLSLTDDSANESPTSTPVGDRYNIVSGAAGTISGSGATYKKIMVSFIQTWVY